MDKNGCMAGKFETSRASIRTIYLGRHLVEKNFNVLHKLRFRVKNFAQKKRYTLNFKTSMQYFMGNLTTPAPIESICQEVSAFFGLSEVQFWVKRDDLLHPIAGGNKLRKLWPVVQHAQRVGAKT